MSDASKPGLTALYSITMLVALTGNILLKRKPETRLLTGFLFINMMAVADLLVTLANMPVSMASL
ncbi:hypothetical protein OS493_027943 [Desmophyllum pertusum]|uniref:Uncharacterized protein n=1 Tax=Desmophyllum pertusum TaxID=174260 RepID=A0A9X0CIF9_9CNID|nr:hypothetical protein OS493_027943 [Desmophyllum pertusum]